MPEKPNSDAANEAEELDASDGEEKKPSASNKADVDKSDKAQSSGSDKAKSTKSKSKDDSDSDSDKEQESDTSDQKEATKSKDDSDSDKDQKESDKKASKSKDDSEAEIVEAGKISRWLTENGFEHESLGVDHLGVEILKVDREFLIPFATALYAYGFNYLQCQGGYDVGPGEDLVSFYSLIKLSDNADRPEEVRIKVFLPREDPKVPTLYWIWKTADWQERETYDMYGIVYEGHPNLKRLLMPEDWVGWPLRKDYISPDFYELQDAY